MPKAARVDAIDFAAVVGARGYDLLWQSHAQAIFERDFAGALADLAAVLQDFTLPLSELIGSGGGESQGTQRLRHSLDARGWRKTTFEIRKTINGVERESQSHSVDHVKSFAASTVALEIEWNNKDPFFDRDLENFKRLHAEGGISAGVIVTRGASLQNAVRDMVLGFARSRRVDSLEALRTTLGLNLTPRQAKAIEKRNARHAFAEAWADQFVADKYGAATTHWAKLLERVQRGVGNPCPLLLLGIPAAAVAVDK